MIEEMIERILIQRNKEVDDMILGEIRKIATENGVDTIITLNDKAIIQALKNFAEVKHGKWIVTTSKYYDPEFQSEFPYKAFQCSVCGEIADAEFPYCHCGAKMDEGDTE